VQASARINCVHLNSLRMALLAVHNLTHILTFDLHVPFPAYFVVTGTLTHQKNIDVMDLAVMIYE